MPVTSFTDKNTWWAELRQSGLLISPPMLSELLPDGPEKPSYKQYRKLRDAYTKFTAWLTTRNGNLSRDIAPLHDWLDVVLEEFLGHDSARWLKGSAIPVDYSVDSIYGERLRPNRILYDSPEHSNPRLFVYVDRSKRVGMGKGRTEYGKFLELLRGNSHKMGLITNGTQFRLCYAGIDYDAWVEWEIDDWFEQEDLRDRLDGFYSLVGPTSINRSNDQAFPLLHAVEESRTRQGDLSAVLGEQVREAVEQVITAVEDAARQEPELLNAVRFTPGGSELSDKEWLSALYQGASRIIMRMVVILFAEAKGMLPRDIHYYNESYGLEGLYKLLQSAVRHEGKLQLHERHNAWIRIKSLFTLIYHGSPHSEITVPSYGGLLFRPGNPESDDPVIRAISVFEDARVRLSDATVFEILQNLKIGAVKVKRGRSKTWARGPVDFGQLRTEYIGIIYEGLLDYELRRAKDDEPIVFLNIGTEPILPLPLLEEMSDKKLKELITDLKKEKTEGTDVDLDEVMEEADPEAQESLEEETEDEESEEEVADEAEEDEEALTRDEKLSQRANDWAMRAVEVAGLVSRRKNEDDYYYRERKAKEAGNLLKKVVDSRGFYLSTSGGTRKGTGTFYTKPQLTVPTAQRTLKPLVYDETDKQLIPKQPDNILSVKVCDPACGSGSFLIAALDYITEALFKSVKKYAEPKKHHNDTIITLPKGEESAGLLHEETVGVPHSDERYDDMLRSKLKRHVVERCIYGVDMNPLAVELCKLSLWVETMDPQLPFGFLDHKIKTGNSLVGCWFDYFQDYPIMAWDRDGGDSSHKNGVHFKKNEWTDNIQNTLKDRVKPELRELIRQRSTQEKLFKDIEGEDPEEIHKEALEVFRELHELPMSANGIEKRERLYRNKIRNNPDYQRLKEAFDLWCAVWFWPADSLGKEAPTPKNFFEPREDVLEIAGQVAREMRFFHWELEFPDVFVGEDSGFNAMLGNPPWEILKPNSKEFFSWYDPLYRARGKQDALDEQTRLFDMNKRIERDWLQYNSQFKGYSNWVKNATNPWGYHDRNIEEESPFNLMDTGPQWRNSDKLHGLWKQQRKKRPVLSNSEHPYLFQGEADKNSYKMFLEMSYLQLANTGRLGFIIPAGIYTDKGTSDLRQLFLHKSNWEWLFGFENRKKVFDIHSSFKFCSIIIEKGSCTDKIKTAFMQHDLKAWAEPTGATSTLSLKQINKFSPGVNSFLEFQSDIEIELFDKFYDAVGLFDDPAPDGWGLKYSREFHMGDDAGLFKPLEYFTKRGFVKTDENLWINNDEIAVPFYEGRIVEQHQFNAKGWVSGKGRGSNWRELAPSEPQIEPQYLVLQKDIIDSVKIRKGPKLGVVRISSATNQRTIKTSLIPQFPCGDSCYTIQCNPNAIDRLLIIQSVLNSFTYDYLIRIRMVGLQVSEFMLKESAFPRPKDMHDDVKDILSISAARLNFLSWTFALEMLEYERRTSIGFTPALKAITYFERLRLKAIIDAIIASIYNITFKEFEVLLDQNRDDPKGFWRVDKDKPLELRQTTLTLAAFRDLKEMGLEAFLSIEDPDGLPGCGWQLPEELTVDVNRDGIIEFDTAAGKTEKVRERLGPRFYPWQLEQSPEESWEECHIHARNILGKEKYERLIEQLESGEEPTDGSDIKVGDPGQEGLFDKDEQIRLF